MKIIENVPEFEALLLPANDEENVETSTHKYEESDHLSIVADKVA